MLPPSSTTAEDAEEPEPDIGEFTKLPNGDDLEKGIMAAPHLGGQVMPYEEVWREIEPGSNLPSNNSILGSATDFILESINDVSQSEPSRPKTASSTFYARIGRYYLVIRQTKTWPLSSEEPGTLTFAALRQDYDDSERCWVTKYSVGDVEGIWNMLSADESKDTGANKPSKLNPGDIVSLGGNDRGERCVVRAISY